VFKFLKDSLEGKNVDSLGKKHRRSPKWRKIRLAHLKDHPFCVVCESTKNLEVHHIIPFHVDPNLEPDRGNLMTLCENKKYGTNCHILWGHLGNFRRYNQEVRLDVVIWNKKINNSLEK